LQPLGQVVLSADVGEAALAAFEEIGQPLDNGPVARIKAERRFESRIAMHQVEESSDAA